MITLHNNKWRCDCNLRNFQGTFNLAKSWSYISIHFFSDAQFWDNIKSREPGTPSIFWQLSISNMSDNGLF